QHNIDPLVDAQRVGTGQIDSFDLRPGYEPRNVFRGGTPAHAFVQVIADAAGDGAVREQLAVMLTVETDDVKAVARRHRRGAEFAGRERHQGLLELRRGLASRDLTEIAALRG